MRAAHCRSWHLLAAWPSPAWATWSVIAVDRSTGRVVIASATCVDRDDQFLMGVQAVVVPGKGVAACQAARGCHAREPDAGLPGTAEGHRSGAHHRDAQRRSCVPERGSSASSICRAGRAGHSGLGNGYVSQDIQGQVPGTEIYYSIQGNILRAGERRAERRAGVPQDERRAHRPGDGGDGSGRRVGRRQPVHVSAVAGRRHAAGRALRRPDVARGLHPHGRAWRHERHVAQRRHVRDVSHRVAAGGRQGARARSGPAPART